MKKTLFSAFTFFLLTLVLLSCDKKTGGETPEPNSPDRKALLTYWADSLVVPGYRSFNGKLATMKAKTTAFTTTPTTATLLEARQSWREAYVEWQKVELFEFGPAEEVSLRNHFNIYPADVAGIQRNITARNYNFDVATSIPQQGFPALDYLLNGIAANDAAIVQQYASSADHRRYLTEVVSKMDQLFANVNGQWNGAYHHTFINNAGTDASSSLSRVVNAYSLYYERFLRAGKIGIPAGVMTSTPLPEKIEAYYHRGALPLQLASTAHITVQRFFVGRTGQPSLSSYLTALGAKDSRTGESLSSLITAQLATSFQKLNTLGPDLHATMTSRNADAVASYNEMQKAVRMIKVDMTSAMGISVTYTDNDGD